jgi:hypothetical protein
MMKNKLLNLPNVIKINNSESNIVVYTTLFGIKADLQKINKKCKIPFICITDTKQVEQDGWLYINIEKSDYTGLIANRRYKYPGGLLFDGISKTIYIDHNIYVNQENIDKFISLLSNESLAAFRHSDSCTVIDEIVNIYSQNKSRFLDCISVAILLKRQLGLPVTENCILYRNYKAENISLMDELIFLSVSSIFARDQIWMPIYIAYFYPKFSNPLNSEPWRNNEYFLYIDKGKVVGRLKSLLFKLRYIYRRISLKIILKVINIS